MKLSRENTFSAEQIRSLAAEGVTVSEMAQRLKVDYNALCDSYIDWSKSDRKAYPIRLLITKSWLEEKMKTMTIADISAETKTNYPLISRFCENYGIARKPMLKNVLSPEVMFSLFVEQSMSDKEIAAKYSVSHETVKKLRVNYGIGSETRTSADNRISIELFHRLYVTYGFTDQQIAALLNGTIYMVRDIRNQFSSRDDRFAEEIRNRSKFFGFQELIEILFRELQPVALFEHLKNNTLAEVAEMYNLIPPALGGIETFSREWFETILRQLTHEEILKKYHIGKAYLKKMIEEYGLSGISPADSLDPVLVKKLYCENYWSDEEIAQSMNTSVFVITSFRKEHGIKRSKRYEISQRLSADEFKVLYLTENMTIVQIAELYGVSDKTISSLKALYAKNSPELLNHTSGGVSEERLQFLKKRLHFKTFTRPIKT